MARSASLPVAAGPGRRRAADGRGPSARLNLP